MIENNTQPGKTGVLEHNGCQLTFRRTGEGPTAIFIQGVGVHGDGWLPQTDKLSDKFTCLSFDNRGMGKSQPLGVKKLTIEQMAKDVIALMDSQGWTKSHVVGHSLGGHVAVALALAAPERIRSLALLCTSARGKDMPQITLPFIWTSIRSVIGPKSNSKVPGTF